MVGVQAPSTDFGYLGKAAKEITEKGDIYAGVGAGVSFSTSASTPASSSTACT